jgi:hypothetical protein
MMEDAARQRLCARFRVWLAEQSSLRFAGEWLLFVAAALWLTSPLAAHWTTALPLGCEDEPVVPLLNLWTQWWNVDRIEHGYADYWQAPIFFPAEHALAFSEPQPLTGLAAWLLAPLLPSPVAVYNVLLWLHLALNGWSTFRMFRSWRCSWVGSLAAGLMVEMMPAVHWQLGIVQLVPVWGIILTLTFLIQLFRRPSLAAGLGSGLSAGATYLLCSYYGLMLGVLLLLTAPILVRKHLLPLGYGRALAAAVVSAAAVAGPIVWMQRAAIHESTMMPPRELVAELSSHPVHFLRTPWKQWVSLPGVEPANRANPYAFSPGTIKLGLAAIGIWTGLRTVRRRRLTLFWIALFVLSSVLAMGPTLSLGGFGPYDFLCAVCPGYVQLRNIHRFATFGQLALVVMAGLGGERLWQRLNVFAAQRQPAARSAALRFAGVLAFVLVLLEAVPGSPRLFATPAVVPAWAEFLQRETSEEDVVAQFPVPADNSLAASRPTALAMYWQMHHKRRVVSGYSGFVPLSYLEREGRLREFPSPATLRELQELGVRWIVVSQELSQALQELASSESFRDAWRLAHEDDETAVFQLLPAAP